MRKKTTMILCGLMVVGLSASAQETALSRLEELEQRTQAIEDEVTKQKRLKVSGYIQTQWQWGEEAASLKVGSANEDKEKSFNRFGIRRGRIKFTYEQGIASGVFQLDITEKDVKFKDAYLNMKDPWVGSMALRGGIFDRPFGNEISYSSSKRESPERSTVFQTLFPDERDLGVMMVLQAPKTSPWSILKLEAGLFAGNGIKPDTDSKKDFIGHLSLSKTIGNSVSFGLGASYYNGKVFQTTQNVYTVKDKSFVLDDTETNKGKFAKREYIGFDAQFSVSSILGLTQLRGEYLFGQQPGIDKSSKSPNYSSLPEADDTYIRDFSGWYVILVQDIGRSPFSAVLKYDSYDPNTKISGDNVDSDRGFTKTDLSQNTFGFGALWKINSALTLQAFHEINRNEKSVNIEGMDKDLNNDVFTLRMQYKF